jgi:serine phosphatase RsbU (regulator of sigma subunit)
MSKQLLEANRLNPISKEQNDSNLDYHEEIAYQKQKLIITDERDKIEHLDIDVFSQPLEMLSGDIYGVIKTDRGAIFYIVDCMGKGVSAAVTAVLCAAFLNRSIKLSIGKDDFDFNRVCSDFTHYIGSYLMEEESLSFIIGHCDGINSKLEYINSGMYPMFIKDRDSQKIESIKATNPPLMRGESIEKSKAIELPNSFLLLAYSDGVCELGDINYKELGDILSYSDSFSTFYSAFSQLTSLNEIKADDDITIIFLNSSLEDRSATKS